MGFYMTSYTAPISEEIRLLADRHEADSVPAPAEISSHSEIYLPKILELCRENGAQPVIIKMPAFRSHLYDGWTGMQSEATARFADENHIPYLDMTDMGLVDLTTDTLDGTHLNVRGAEKVSVYLEDCTCECNKTCRKSNCWNR